MIVAGSYGTANLDLIEGTVVILGPPVTLLAGIGLLRRWRWAWAYMLAALLGLVVWSASKIIKGPSPERTTTSASGTRTTISATTVDYAYHGTIIVIGLGLFTGFLSRSVRAEFEVDRRRRTPSNPSVDRSVPGGPWTESTRGIPSSSDVPPRRSSPAGATPEEQKNPRGLSVAIIALLAVTGGMGWLVQNGIGKGETFFPAKTGSQQRTVSRSEKPALFWTSIGLYTILGSGTLGLALWSIRKGFKGRSAASR
jgi:hypothetical protein